MARRPANRNRPDDAKQPDFEFCVTGRPVSAQAANRLLLQVWKAKVAASASTALVVGQQPFGCDVELRVTHYSERRIADRDNLMKPIQDALQGIAYFNDHQVKDATSNWRDINGRFNVRFMSMALAVAFSQGDEFLHIRLWISPDTEDLG